MPRTALCACLLGLCVSLLGSLAQAREWLVVGTSFPQVYEQNAAGDFTGLAPAVLRQLAAELGDELRFELYPWARAQRMVELGQADILVGPYRTAEREARFAFAAEPFYQDRIVFYARRGHEPDWDGDYASLQNKRLAVVRGWVYGSQFEEMRERLRPITVESVRNGLRMLAAGRIDLLASNQRNTRPHLLALGLQEDVRELLPLIDVQRGFFAFPRDDDHTQLRLRFDRAFARLVESGQLARLAEPLGVNVP
ncbi:MULTISPECIES: transporter substrate-binding domain-containing protein [unclassified Pseudomonas]|uniref:substrate-binding periplasmic protein n=1 Tax=unclassified Pseudomonas TaxID=196821 RepID=UPI002449AE0A|nr:MULTISPECIES: transporter substrate-binding domain-containing protein [unclassified Pseudomonas]MDG9923149.1 transporter substrate-binding domain-containing protein [Pseudomonas sp. GD04045]MDH0034774.1 transporter substrate-binding domain-containing protein [Pseudomonas sp. GD04019]